MDRRPIESIMTTAMESIRDMVDVNTVIGEPIAADDGSTVIPISKVCFGFVAGGGDYNNAQPKSAQQPNAQQSNAQQPSAQGELPFAGGASAGVTVQPMGFLVVNGSQVRLLPVQHYAPLDRVIELAPQVMAEIKNWIASRSKSESSALATAENADA